MSSVQNKFPVPAVCKNIIDGKVYETGEKIPVICPETEACISYATEADDKMVDMAVDAARRAFETGPWARLDIEERQKILLNIADLIEANLDELAWLETANIGMPLSQSSGRHLPRAVYNFRFFAEYISQSKGQVFDQQRDYLTLVTREAVGVAALIGPWNAPMALTTMKIAGAIAFGNSCVVKPSEVSPLTAFRLVELLHEAGLPNGVVNLVNGRGSTTGAALSAHPGIDRLSFTGGTATGRHIMASAGQNLVPVTLELGGKGANIIFDDADYERALDSALLAVFSNNGQQCLAGSRILIQRTVLDRFVKDFTARVNNLKIGSPFDEATEIGPLATKSHYDRVLSFMNIAQDVDCQILSGGHAVDTTAPGFFVHPTVILTHTNSLKICQQEVFGPFVTIQPFDTDKEAFDIANDTSFGLVSYVWTSNLDRAFAAHKKIRSGTVLINTPIVRELRAPFGGFDDSGVGRESGPDCEAFYTEQKTTVIPVAKPSLTRLGASSP